MQFPRPIFHSLAGQLLLWFAAPALVLLATGLLLAGRHMAQAGQEATLASLQHTAQGAGERISNALRERELEVDLMSRSLLLSSAALDSLWVQNNLALHQESHEEYAWIGVADAQGLVVTATNGLLLGQSVKQRPWYIAGRDMPFTGDIHEALLLAKLLPPLPSGEPLRFVDIANPIRNAQGALRGVLAAHVNWKWITDTLDAVVRHDHDPAQVQVFVVGKGAKLLYPLDIQGGTRLPDLAALEAHGAVVPWADGKRYLTVASKVPPTRMDLEWSIVLRQDLAVHQRTALQAQALLAGLLLALVLLWSVALYRLRHQVQGRVAALVQALQHTARDGVPDRHIVAAGAVADFVPLEQAVGTLGQTLLQHRAATAQQQTQQLALLADRADEYRQLAEHAADVVYRLDGQGRVEWISASITAFAGWPCEALVGKPLLDWVHPDQKEWVQAMQSKLASGVTSRFDARIRTQSGDFRWVAVLVQPLPHAASAGTRSVGSWRAISGPAS